MAHPKYELFYWPLPFRGCFISYLFAYRDEPLLEVADFEEILSRMNQHPGEQAVPFMGPPVLLDRESGQALSQMPAIVLYASRELDLLPDAPFDVAMSMKTLMDCNDILMEICRYNGSIMWEREPWIEFRSSMRDLAEVAFSRRACIEVIWVETESHLQTSVFLRCSAT